MKSLLYLCMTINVETCYPRALSEEAKLGLAYFYYLILYAPSSTKAPLQFIVGSERTFYLNLLVGVVNCSLNNIKYVLRGKVILVRTAVHKIPRQESVVARLE